MPFVYILRCADDTLYVGHTHDVIAREKTHNEGRVAHYTTKRRPVRVVYFEEQSSLTKATARKRQLKGWTAKKKEALIAGSLSTLRQLSKRRKK